VLRRKAFVFERNLIDLKKTEKKKSKEEKELYDKLRIYARLVTKEEHQELVNSLLGKLRNKQT